MQKSTSAANSDYAPLEEIPAKTERVNGPAQVMESKLPEGNASDTPLEQT